MKINFTIEKIETFMKEFQLNTRELGDLLGFHKDYIARILRGEKAISHNVQVKLNRLYEELTSVENFKNRMSKLNENMNK